MQSDLDAMFGIRLRANEGKNCFYDHVAIGLAMFLPWTHGLKSTIVDF